MVRLQLNAAKSSGREFANAVTKLINRNCSFKVCCKVQVQGKDIYKLTWYYNDDLRSESFLDQMDELDAFENDDFEYDVEGNVILPSDTHRRMRENKPTPSEFMRALDESGRFRFLCLNYGLQQKKPIKFTERTSDYVDRILPLTDEGGSYTVYFITCYVEQTVSQQQVGDEEWMMKCLEYLLRYHKVYKNDKRVYIDEREAWYQYMPSTVKVTKHANVITIQKRSIGRQGNNPDVWENTDDSVEFLRTLIHKYYPDLLDHLVFDTNESSIIIEVH